MRNFRKRLLTACLAAVIAVSAASMPAWSETEDTADIADAPAEEAASEAGDAEEDNGIYVTEAEAMEGICRKLSSRALCKREESHFHGRGQE